LRAAAAAGLALAVLVSAQTANYVRAFPLLAALDTDGDGSLSAAEIANSPTALRALDTDGDGKLNYRECGLGGASDPASKQGDEMVKTYMAFDKNGDGKLQREEVPERMQGLFERGDANHDGVLTAEEIHDLAAADYRKKNGQPEQDAAWLRRTAMVSMRLMPVLAVLDANHDGELSSAEIDAAPAALATLDTNHDGRLTEDEVRPDPVTSLAARAFLAFDTDGDFRISLEEMQAPAAAGLREVFASADRNHDGYVTVAELKAEITQRADLNHDGVVSRDEMQQASQSGMFGPSGIK
jgi:Ca2+-binding EF-hand superfamily protein